MRKFLISAALISATMVAAAPASAQYYGNRHHQGDNIEQQLDRIAERIRRADERDLISRSEARRLLVQADRIDDQHRRFRRNGLSGWEHQQLQRQVHHLRQQLRWERQEGRYDNRRDRYEDRYDDRYEDRYDY